MSKFENDGYIILKNAVPNSTIDRINMKISEEKLKLHDYGFSNKILNFGNRIGRFHYIINEYYEILDHIKENIKRLLPNPLLMGSLTFENGSCQGPHIDNWFFYTKPIESMIGVWVALEDIDDDSGPLFYYENSHKLELSDPIDFQGITAQETGSLLTQDLLIKIKDLIKTR